MLCNLEVLVGNNHLEGSNPNKHYQRAGSVENAAWVWEQVLTCILVISPPKINRGIILRWGLDGPGDKKRVLNCTAEKSMGQQGRNQQRTLSALDSILIFYSYFWSFEGEVEKRNRKKGQEKEGIWKGPQDGIFWNHLEKESFQNNGCSLSLPTHPQLYPSSQKGFWATLVLPEVLKLMVLLLPYLCPAITQNWTFNSEVMCLPSF